MNSSWFDPPIARCASAASARLLSSTQSEGRSALLDAIYLGVREIRKARNPRKALLVISDGADNGSRDREFEIRSLLDESFAMADGRMRSCLVRVCSTGLRNGPAAGTSPS